MKTFSFDIDTGASCEETPRVDKINFGDGYTQRVTRGINAFAQTWPLSFSNREQDEAAQIIAFFREVRGVESFTWTNPLNETILVICEKWTIKREKANRVSIVATFQQVFG